MKEKNFLSTLFIPIILAILGIVIPITWDWWNRKSSLTVYHLQETNLVEKKGDVPGLTLTYEGIKIDSVTKLIFKIQNTGRIVIDSADLIKPPEIFISNAKILSASIESSWPNNLNPTINLMNNKATIEFRLLNPNEYFIVSLLTDSNTNNYLVDARIRGISQLAISKIDEQASFISKITFGLGFAGFLSVIFIIAGFGLLSEIPKQNRVISLINNNQIPIRKDMPIDDVNFFINSELDFLNPKALQSIKTIIPKNSVYLTAPQAKRITNEIRKKTDSHNGIPAIIFSFVIGFYGVYYVLNQIYHWF